MLYGKKIIFLTLSVIFATSCASISKRGPSLKERVVLRAQKLVGAPYKFGGADLTGFDCSGFVHYVFSNEDILLPRSTNELFKKGKTVPMRRAQKGDILFFKTEKENLHVGIYMGKRTFIHASSTGVKIEVLNKFWKKRMVKIKRVI